MKKSNILAAVAAAITLSATSVVFAAAPSTTPSTPAPAATTTTAPASDMEPCKVVDKNGVGLIKANMDATGKNAAGDANAWISVPKGECAKINAGDFSGVTPDIKAKIVTQ